MNDVKQKKKTTVTDVLSLQRSSMMQCSSTIEDTSFIENRDATVQAEVSTLYGQQQPGNVSVSQASGAVSTVGQAAKKKRKNNRQKKSTNLMMNPGETTDEAILFCHPAKLFRFDSAQKEWKVRGVGDMKILHHPGINSYRILFRMRNSPWMVVCNHELDLELILRPSHCSETAWMWIAMDFSQGQQLVKQHFAARFTTPEMASLFHVKVLECQAALRAVPAGPVLVPPPGNPGEDKEMMDRDEEGRRLRKMDNLKIIDDYDMLVQVSTSSASILLPTASGQQQPGNVSVSQTSAASPIVAQAAKKKRKRSRKKKSTIINTVETADEAILFCHPAKLSCFDSVQKEWKVRGVGDMKILHDRGSNSYRILLRMRDLPFKAIICNHCLDLDLILKPAHSSKETAWTWSATDFSQGQLVERHFAASFATPELASLFKSKVLECQEALWAVSADPVPVPPPGNSGEEKETRDEEARVVGKMDNLKIIDDYDIDQLLKEIDFVVRQ